MVKLDGKNFDIVEDNISRLKEIFPEVVTGDNQIDFDNLRDILEKDVEVVDDSEEHYKFTWWGKKKAKQEALKTTTKTLRPNIKDSKNWDTTGNVYIEGDNLDALRILSDSYRNSIKMIYIDPPYNTGKDFVYHDNRGETEQEYLESTNQVNEEGQLLENPKTDGKFHSNWLNMMYPRLYNARKLLTDDGIIYISISDEEENNLRKICDEIFGENNFIARIIWTNKEGGGSSDSKLFKIKQEYILAYGKNIDKVEIKGIPVSDVDRYSEKDEYFETRGPYQLVKLDSASLTYSDSLNYPLECPDGTFVYPSNSKDIRSIWRWSPKKVEWGIENDYIVFKKKNNVWNVYTKQYLNADNEGNIISRTNRPVPLIDKHSSTKASKHLQELFDNTKVFDYSKPFELIKYLMELSIDDEDLVLDFFSGSATTAESLMEFNVENNFDNKFILVQLDEETQENSNSYKAGFNNIFEIGKERIERAGDKIIKENENTDLDIGFKLFKIAESNFIPWNPKLNTPEDVEQEIIKTANNIVQGCSELDLVYELLLKLNLDLNVSIEEKQINNKFYIVDEGFLVICLDNPLSESIAKDIVNLKKELMIDHCKVVLLDDALDSVSSINISNELDSEDIEFYTI